MEKLNGRLRLIWMYLIKLNSCKYALGLKWRPKGSLWLAVRQQCYSLIGWLSCVFFLSCCYVCWGNKSGAKDKAGHILITLRWSNDLANVVCHLPFMHVSWCRYSSSGRTSGNTKGNEKRETMNNRDKTSQALMLVWEIVTESRSPGRSDRFSPPPACISPNLLPLQKLK